MHKCSRHFHFKASLHHCIRQKGENLSIMNQYSSIGAITEYSQGTSGDLYWQDLPPTCVSLILKQHLRMTEVHSPWFGIRQGNLLNCVSSSVCSRLPLKIGECQKSYQVGCLRRNFLMGTFVKVSLRCL